MTGLALALSAEALVGAPFRLHGRNAQTGVDCVGLIALALAGIGRQVRFPNGYALRGSPWPGLDALAQHHGFVHAQGDIQPGDICLLRPSALQSHFAIVAASSCAIVEAHAGLRRVTLTPLPAAKTVAARWRLFPEI